MAHGNFGRVAAISIPGPMAQHVHHHCHVLFKAWGSDVTCTVGERQWELTDDTALLINPWESHNLGRVGDRWPVAILALYIEPAWLADSFGDRDLAATRRLFDHPVVPLTPELRVARAEMLEALDGRTAAAEPDVETMIAAVLAPLLSDDASTFVRPGLDAVADDGIRRALDIIRGRHGWVSEMSLVARQVGMSRPRFFARFRAATGLAPALYANRCRIEHAVSGLERPDVSLSDLSIGLGFSEQANFTRFFRRHFGAPPGVYRRGLDVRGPVG